MHRFQFRSSTSGSLVMIVPRPLLLKIPSFKRLSLKRGLADFMAPWVSDCWLAVTI
jgi:hypothetical protein